MGNVEELRVGDVRHPVYASAFDLFFQVYTVRTLDDLVNVLDFSTVTEFGCHLRHDV